MSDLLISKEQLESMEVEQKRLKHQEREMMQKMLKQPKMKYNKDNYEEHEPRAQHCNLYNPCPVCSKCSNKASNLYYECQECLIPMCTHKHEDKSFLIKRSNFKVEATEDVKKIFQELSKTTRP